MIRLGDYNNLEVLSIGKDGATVSDGSKEILMPNLQCDETVVVGAKLDLFVYRNSNDEIIATTKKPYAKIGEFAALEVVDTTPIGVFLDWGLDKDLFIPHSQMLGPMEVGKTYVVRIIADTISRRIIASPRLRPFMNKTNPQDHPEGTKVTALIYENREHGVMAIIDGRFQAMFAKTEFPKPQVIGSTVEAFIKKYDEEGRLTISRAPVGQKGWSDAEKKMMDLIAEKDGLLPLNDKSSPEMISRVTGMSKKSFKKVIGGLYRQQLIEITEAGVRLIEQ
jgi:predicted RNA-binding protein (virulence factor B family)